MKTSKKSQNSRKPKKPKARTARKAPKAATPEIQLIANLVVQRGDGRVLLVRYDPDDERGWLPGRELVPYQHPDEAARAAVADLRGLTADPPRFTHVESFRGRRGWHVVFHYHVRAKAGADVAVAGGIPSSWHAPAVLPRTMHGPWEREVVAAVLARA